MSSFPTWGRRGQGATARDKRQEVRDFHKYQRQAQSSAGQRTGLERHCVKIRRGSPPGNTSGVTDPVLAYSTHLAKFTHLSNPQTGPEFL